MEVVLQDIYLDNAATTYPKPEAVYAAMDRFAREKGATPAAAGTAVPCRRGARCYGQGKRWPGCSA